MNQDTSHVLTAIDHALDDYETSADAMRWTPEPVAPAPDQPLVPQQWADVINADVERAFARMAQAITAMVPAVQSLAQNLGPILERAGLTQWQQAKRHGPMPLPIDGHAYRRRQRARRRR